MIDGLLTTTCNIPLETWEVASNKTTFNMGINRGLENYRVGYLTSESGKFSISKAFDFKTNIF